MGVQTSKRRAGRSVAAAALGLLLTGCGGTSGRELGGTGPIAPPIAYPGVGFRGVVQGGAAPIAGASVQLYSAGTTGAASSGSTLLLAPLTTDSAGSFTIPAGYACSSSDAQLYLLARGGSVVSTQTSNQTLALLRAVGTCGAVVAGATAVIDEVSTVAGVWALAQFLGPQGAIGATTTNATGLRNAFATGESLRAAVAGMPQGAGFTSNGVAPAAMINTLADLLHLCVADAGSPGCGRLLALTTPAGGSAPADTLETARDLALNPDLNVAALFALGGGGGAFQPALTTPPADWTLRIVYSGGGLHAPDALGVNSQGAVWVANYFGVLSAFSPVGVPLFASGITGSGLDSSYGLAIDGSDNVWVTNENTPGSVNRGLGSIAKFSPAGQALSGATGFVAGGLNFPVATAIDADGTVWVVNYGNTTVTLLDATGTPLSGAAGYRVKGGAFPVAVALDTAHNGWIGDQNDGTVTRVSPDGRQITNFACCNASAAVAIDQAGAAWIANFAGASVSRVASGGTATIFHGGGLTRPQGIAIDGAGRVWVANFGAAALTQLAGANDAQPGAVLSPAAGWGADGTVAGAFAVAIDAGGDVWVSGFNDDTLTEYVGLAAPVRTPLLGPAQAP